MAHSDAPFSTIENAHEFLGFLGEAIDDAIAEVQQELAASAGHQQRQVDAWRVVLHTTTKLSGHVSASRRLLNDLRTLRNLLNRTADETAAPSPAVLAAQGTGA
jgi:hypothetical protein